MDYVLLGLASAALLLSVPAVKYMAMMRMQKRQTDEPTDWKLNARPLFRTDERKLYRFLREARPHHVILAKVSLARFCQPVDFMHTQYWYEKLGSTCVSFAVCTHHGKVLAVIDVERGLAPSPESVKLKRSALAACRIAYLICPSGQFPTMQELQSLVPEQPESAALSSAPQEMTVVLNEASETLSNTIASRRQQRAALWRDSVSFQDSFFLPNSRLDGGADSGFMPQAQSA